MEVTSFLGLKTYNDTTDGSALFLAYRTDISGVTTSSNMGIIDSFASGVSGSITALQGTRSVYAVSGSYVDENTYGASGISGLTYSNNQMISLSLNVENSGTTTLNINNLGTKSLLKADIEGNLVNLSAGDLKKNREYLFRYNGTNWVWTGHSSGTQTSINGTAYNLVMISGCGTLADSGIAISGSKISGCALQINSSLTTTSGSLSLANTGIVAGSYNRIELDIYGRAISGSVVSLLSSISGSSIMSSTTGSIVKHNTSGVVSGSYNQVQVDSFGHITSGSFIPQNYLSSISGSSIMSDTTGSIVKHNVSGIIAGSYNRIESDIYGHIITGSIVDETLVSSRTINDNETLLISDKNKLIILSGSAAKSVTIPPSSSVNFPIGTSVAFFQSGTGLLTIIAGSGVNLLSEYGLKLNAQYAVASSLKIDTDTWVMAGSLKT